jgi:hypothetical protein
MKILKNMVLVSFAALALSACGDKDEDSAADNACNACNACDADNACNACNACDGGEDGGEDGS